MNSIEILKKLEKDTKKKYGTEVFITGGFVRDFLRKKKNNDLDVIVRFMPMDKVENFLSKYGKTKSISIHKNNPIDIIIFQSPTDDFEVQVMPPKGRKKGQDSVLNTLKQDSKERDFTINSMYVSVNNISYKSVIDYWGGKDSIKSRIIITVGNPNTVIKKSPIRMLRAFSLASRIRYTISKELFDSIKKNKELIRNSSFDEIRNEFVEILLSKEPSKYIKLMQKSGLLKIIIPELEDCVKCSQDNRFHKYSVFNHLVYTCDNTEPDVVMRLAGLFHDIGKPVIKGHKGNKMTFHKHEVVGARIAAVIMKRLRFSNEIISKVTHLIRMHMYHYTREYSDAGVRRFINSSGVTKQDLDNLSEFPLFKLRVADRLGNGYKSKPVTARQIDFEERIKRVYIESNGLTLSDLAVDGNDIMTTFSIKPSKKVGNILKYLLERVMENPKLNNRNDLLHLTLDLLEKESGDENK
jgi:putative nucleotidyltransferase with HDIG domain